MLNGVEVYLPTREEMVLYLTTTAYKLAERLGPNDIVIVSYVLAGRLCSYLLTVALLSSREIRELAQGRGMRVLSPGDFLR